MLRLFGSAVLISQLKVASAAECAAHYGTDGSVTPLDTCVLGLVKYYCENGVAYSAGFCDAAFVSEVNVTETPVYCDADPCEVATMNLCSDTNGTTECVSIPYVLNQCVGKTNNGTIEYESTYCDSTIGLVSTTYTDSECSSEESSVPLTYLATILGGAGGSFSIDSNCNATVDSGTTLTSCEGDDCDGECYEIPLYLGQCTAAGEDEDTGELQYSSVYCDECSGLMLATYTDSECSDQQYAIPYETYLGGDDTACLTIETDCVGSDDCDDGDDGDDDYVDCPTGVVYAQLDGDEDVELPYIPLGLCSQYSAPGQSLLVECDDSGVANYYIYLGDTCSGTALTSGELPLSEEDDPTTFRTACNTDVPCTFARFTMINYDEDAGECGSEVFESTAYVGECVSNGTVSTMVSCDDTSVTRAVYTSLDCTGDAVEEESVMYEFGGDERCPGEVVDCFMTDNSPDDDTDGDGSGEGSGEGSDEDPDDGNNSGVSKIVVSQMALLSVAMIASLLA